MGQPHDFHQGGHTQSHLQVFEFHQIGSTKVLDALNACHHEGLCTFLK